MDQNDSALRVILDFLIDSTPLEKLPKVDAIFLFGHIDPRLPKHAASLYKAGKAPKIIISGKGRKEIIGFENEAQYFASILESEGIPRDAMILEEKARNSLENVLLSMETCKKINFNPQALILVAVPALLKRSRATFAKQFPNIKTYGSAFEVPFEEWKLRRKRLLGEFDRFDEYVKAGGIKKISIPVAVVRAVKILRENLSDQDGGVNSFYPI